MDSQHDTQLLTLLANYQQRLIEHALTSWDNFKLIAGVFLHTLALILHRKQTIINPWPCRAFAIEPTPV